MKRFLSIILIFVFILSAMPIEVLANEYPDRFGNLTAPIIGIKDMEVPSIDPGRSKSITLNLHAIGNDAYDVVAVPKFSEPLSSNNLTNTVSLGNIRQSGSQSLKLDVVVSENAEPGNYPIELVFNFSYYVGMGSERATGSYTEVVYVSVSGRSSTPKLLITELSTEPEVILAGQDVKLNVLFENRGNRDANNVNVRLEGLKSDGGFYIGSGTDVQYINRVPGNMISSLVYDLKAASNIERGSHELELVFEYGQVEERQKIYLTVGGSASHSSNLLMENLEYPTAGIGPNRDFVLKFDLRNNSDSDAVNILVKAESSDPAVVPKSTSILKLNNIEAGETEKLSFVFSPTEDAITRNYPINISVEYEDEFNQGDDQKHVTNQFVGMYVVADDSSENTSKAKLIIDKYSFAPQLVRAGENFEMNLSFYNTSSTKTVRNIKIFLTSEPGSSNEESNSSAFTPVNSSNTFYIDSIPPRGRIEKTITMYTIPDAIAKTHTIMANFEYEDSDDIEYTGITELIGVPVIQQSKLEVGEVGFFPEAYVGQSTPISLEFYNTGKVTLYNMMVKLEGDFQTENAQYYVGNFTSGSSEYFEGYVIPMEMGELAGDVVFTYEDSTGQMQEVRKEFSLNIGEMPVYEDPWGEEMPPFEEETGLLKSPGLWITLAVIAAIGGIVFYRKKKKSKELSLDE